MVTRAVSGPRGAQVLDAQGHRDILADDAEARRLLDNDAAIGLVRLAVEQHMERRLERRLVAGGDVINLTVRDQRHAGEPLGRNVD